MAEEYIRKQDAIAVAESYQVERTGFHLNDYEYGRNQVADSIASDLEDIEPADVVPVVRCKECKFRENDDFCTGRGFPCQLVPDDGFCDKGERKE
jgi:hypothetical protein